MLRLALCLTLAGATVFGAQGAPRAAEPAPLLMSIEALTRSVTLSSPRTILVRGVVTLAREQLVYLQDQTGAVAVYPMERIHLAIGDEVEVQGEIKRGDYSPAIEHARLRRLWSGSAPVPLALKPEQAAEGSFSSRLVDTEGRLLQSVVRDNYLRLTLEADHQIFSATLELSSPLGGNSSLLQGLEDGATLRVVGICVPGLGKDASAGNAFVVLLRSRDDIRVVAPAPWWNVQHAAYVGCAAVLLVSLFYRLRHRAMNQRFQAIVEERSRIAREMHDTLAQGFSGLTYQLEGMSGALHKPGQSEAVNRHLSMALQLLRHCREDAHRSIFALRSLTQTNPDLVALLLSSCDSLKTGSVRISGRLLGRAVPIGDEALNHLLRIGQEAITNAVRHAGASEIVITARYEPEALTLEVSDNGQGFAPAVAPSAESGHFGLLGMRERARRLGAALEIRSEAGAGTLVSVRLPLRKSGGWRERLAALKSIVRSQGEA